MSRITPCLWFDGAAEEAAHFYAGLIPDSRVDRVNTSPVETPSGPARSVLTVEFTLNGQSFLGLNGGPHFKFNEAVSFILECENQAEIDRYWAALGEGGQPSQCGWLKDRYGLSWQIVPRQLMAMLREAEGGAAARVMTAVMGMGKLELAALEKAYEGGA
jgi:predicted 3-demethylubiquinone-9 3-methyltransferase (glyoxalase superfamily)